MAHREISLQCPDVNREPQTPTGSHGRAISRCNGELVRLDSTSADVRRCARCEGLWSDLRSVSSLLDRRGRWMESMAFQEMLDNGELPRQVRDGTGRGLEYAELTCPVCQRPMEMTNLYTLPIALCRRDGAWLSAAALRVLANDTRQGAPKRGTSVEDEDTFEKRLDALFDLLLP